MNQLTYKMSNLLYILVRDATSSIEARKKRKDQQEAAKQNLTLVNPAILCPSSDSQAQTMYRNLEKSQPSSQDNQSLVASLGSCKAADMSNRCSPSSLQASFNSMFAKNLGDRNSSFLFQERLGTADAPSTTLGTMDTQLQGISQSSDFLKAGNHHRQDLQPNSQLTATSVWRRRAVASHHPPPAPANKSNSDSDDEQFLAYIDDVLGPLPPDAVLTYKQQEYPQQQERYPTNN